MALTDDYPPSFADPVQAGAVERPTGEDLFKAMTEDEQDEAFGSEVAAALRSGEVEISDLVLKGPGDLGFITQASPVDLGLKPKDG